MCKAAQKSTRRNWHRHCRNSAATLRQLCAASTSPEAPDSGGKSKFLRIWNLRTKGVETFFHTLCGVLYAAWRRPDILHIHSIGPAIFTPLARALGLRVVVTYHSLNYEHAKWGRFARSYCGLGDGGFRFSRRQIAVSDGLAKLMNRKYGAHVIPIPNGLGQDRSLSIRHVLYRCIRAFARRICPHRSAH